MSDEPLLREPPVEPREFRANDWEVKALQAALSGRDKTSALAALANACCCSDPGLAGGIGEFKMGVEVAEATWRNVRYQDALMRVPAEGMDTLGAIWRHACKKFEHNPCMGKRDIVSMTKDGSKEKYDLSPYSWLTYGQAYRRAQSFGRGLASLGVLGKGDRLNFFAETKPEWQLAAQACYEFGYVVSTTYANLGPDAVEYGIKHTDSKVVFTDADLLPTVCKVLAKCPSVKHVVFISDPRPASHPASKSDAELREAISNAAGGVQGHSFEQIVKLGEAHAVDPFTVDKSDLAMIMFTSGSTGNPKGVMISHENCVAAIAGASDAITGMGQDDVYLAYLPLAHILEVCAEGASIATGVAIGYGSTKTVTDNSVCVDTAKCKGDANELRPTLMAAVPMIMDKIRAGVTEKIEKTGGAVKAVFDRAYKTKAKALARGRNTPFWNKLLFDNLRAKLLGGRVRYMLSGGGPLSSETQEFMNVVFCCPVGQGYGLTETVGVATTVWPNDRTFNRVGAPIASVQIKLVDWEEGGYFVKPKPDQDCRNPRGEVLIGGPQITLGYYKEKAKTDESYFEEDGVRWFRTGDIGEMHPDGVLQVIDRKKDLVKLSHGEYISLGKLEPLIRNSDLVDNAMVYANSQKSYCVALVTRPANAGPVDKSKIQADIERIFKREGCAKFEVPKRIHVCEEEWGPHNDLCTAALKLKRQNIIMFYKETLEQLYE